MSYFVPYVKQNLIFFSGFPAVDSNVLFRLQTHTGDNIPTGLFQDLAMTSPASADGHSVAAWKDIYGSFTAYQNSPSLRPELKFVSGVPVLRFYGSGSYLSGIVNLGQTGAALTVGYNIYSDLSYSIVENKPNNSYYFLSGVSSFGVLRNNVLSGYPTDMPPSGQHTVSITSFSNYNTYIDGAWKGERSGNYSGGVSNLLIGIGYNATGGIASDKSFNGDIYGVMAGKLPSYKEKFENYFKTKLFT